MPKKKKLLKKDVMKRAHRKRLLPEYYPFYLPYIIAIVVFVVTLVLIRLIFGPSEGPSVLGTFIQSVSSY